MAFGGIASRPTAYTLRTTTAKIEHEQQGQGLILHQIGNCTRRLPADLIVDLLVNGDAPVVNVDVNAVRLQQAVLCADCEVITDSPHDACAICGSRSLLPLSRVLGEIRPTSIPTVQEAAVQRPSVVPDGVFVLTSPVPHRPRHRRRTSPR